MAGGTILDYLKYDFSKRDCLPLVFQSRLNEDRCFGFDWALRRKRRIFEEIVCQNHLLGTPIKFAAERFRAEH